MNALIVDDGPIARQILREELELLEDVTVVGEAEDGQQALRQIKALRPDLVLLDLQMPVMGGFEVIRRLKGGAALPAIVIVTAWDQYAIQAFDAGAIDYLLKPVLRERLLEAVERARRVTGRIAERRQAEGKGSLALRQLGPSVDPGEGLANTFDHVRMLHEEIGSRPAQGLTRFLAEWVGAHPGGEGDHALTVDRKQHDRGAVDDRQDPRFALAELALHLEALFQLVSKHGLLAIQLSGRHRGGPPARAAQGPRRRRHQHHRRHGEREFVP